MKTIKTNIIIILFLLLNTGFSVSQNIDISGKWSGVLTQPNIKTALADEYLFSMKIFQEGDSIWGTTEIKMKNNEEFGVMFFTGTIARNLIIINENGISNQYIRENGWWCIKNLTLKYNSKIDMLEGSWNSDDDCGGGKVYLNRNKQTEQKANEELQITENISDIPNEKNIIIDTISNIEIADNKYIVNNIYFDRGDYDLSRVAKKELDKIYDFLENNDEISLFISGYTDNYGDEDELLKLSENRVNAVIEYLIEKGIDTKRLEGKGFGGENLLYEGDSESERARNRRIEIEIIY